MPHGATGLAWDDRADWDTSSKPQLKTAMLAHCAADGRALSKATPSNAVKMSFDCERTWNTAGGRCAADTNCRLFCSVNRTPGGISNRHLRDNGDSQRASRDAGKWTRHLAEMISCRTVEINSWAERLVQASHARHPASLMASASRTVDVAAYRAPLVDDRRNAKVSAEFWSTLHGSVPRRRCKSERAPYQKPERCPFQHLRIAVSIAGELQLETTYCPTAFSVFEDKNHFGGLQAFPPGQSA